MAEIRVSQISIYPIKSTTGIHLNHAFVEQRGLAFDRRLVVARPDGQFLTGRSHPKLLQIHSALISGGLHLRAPDCQPLDLFYDAFEDSYAPLQLWDDSMQAQRCGVEIDAWFSAYLDEPVQLLYYGDDTRRQRASHDGVNEGEVSFADGYPLLLISQASLDDLNQRLVEPVPMAQFRPNLVLKGCQPFAEDSWQRIRIGEVIFESTKPCSRCVLTTVNPDKPDPDSGEVYPDPQQQPLATLARYRKGDNGKGGSEVYFGQNLVAVNSGKISLYDEIEVLQSRTAPQYPDNAPLIPQPALKGHLWQPGELASLQCVSVRDETADVKTFSFKLLQPIDSRCDFLAGQFICLELEIDGAPVLRNYTLSSSPSRPDRLSITVKRVDGGRVSNWLNDNLRVGDVVRAKAPDGDFHSFCAPQDKVLLLSAGSGITPMLSMLRWMTDLQLGNDIVFVHSAHCEADLIARQEIELLAQQHGRCEVIYTLSKANKGDMRCFRGRLDRTMLETVPDLTQRQTFVCGPHPFMEQAKSLLLSLGLPEQQYFDESFGVRDGDRGSEAAAPVSVNILFDSWDAQIEGDTQHTVLEQAEKSGLDIPFSCRGGFCGSCRIKLESGEVEVLQDSGLSEKDREEGYILACSCKPKSDLVLTSG